MALATPRIHYRSIIVGSLRDGHNKSLMGSFKSITQAKTVFSWRKWDLRMYLFGSALSSNRQDGYLLERRDRNKLTLEFVFNITWVLHHDEEKIFIRSDHDFVFQRSNAEEGQIILYQTVSLLRTWLKNNGIVDVEWKFGADDYHLQSCWQVKGTILPLGPSLEQRSELLRQAGPAARHILEFVPHPYP